MDSDRMKNLEINVFGELRILVDDVDISQTIWSSKKKTALLEILILNRQRPMSVSRLAEMIWGEDEEINAENALKTLISRLRKDLEENGLPGAIVTIPGGYMWNPDLPAKIDVFRMEDLCNTLSDAESLDPDVRDQFEELLQLYTDDLLTNSSLSKWITPKSVYYHDLYLKTVYRYIELLNKEKEYGDVIRVCKIALDIDAFYSVLNLELMSALLNTGKNKEALEQYQNTTNLQYTHLGLKPSDEILNFYKELIKGEKSSEAEIEEICEELRNGRPEAGAFVCEYAIFNDIYHLQMRNLKRLDTSMFLALVDVHRMDNRQMEALELKQVMARTLDLLQENLRQGDTISRYSPLQYVILLPSVPNAKMGRMVVERLKRLFYSNSKNAKYIFSYSVTPLVVDD
ncbi:MAG: AfsR/SARP family transcriptional regulator [Saccharofermentanales bacterium]|jgi:DNA-binding SARP family transcriptional activator